jgi:CSLREA domain-containing protein
MRLNYLSWLAGLFLMGFFGCIGIRDARVTPSQVVQSQSSSAPKSISYSVSSSIYVYNDASASLTFPIVNNIPINQGGTPTSYSISPDLTALTGISFSSTTGVISGSPTLTSPATTYTVTAINSEGSTSTTLNIRTGPGFLVNSSDDANDNSTSDNQCLSTLGTCSLRAAITQINAMSTGLNRLILIPEYTITLLGNFSLTNSMEIIGAGQGLTILDGNGGAYGLFTVSSGILGQSISNLTLQNSRGTGFFTSSGYSGPISLNSITINNIQDQSGFGAIFINTAGQLTLNSSLIENSSSSTGTPVNAVTCYQATSCTITNTVFTGNIVSGVGNGVLVPGAFLSDQSTQINISGCQFDNNSTTALGGAIIIYNGLTTISNSTFTSNSAYKGGAIFFYTFHTTSTVNLKNVTIANNISSVASGGGGIYVFNAGTSLNILNSILAGNKANSVANNCGYFNGGNIASTSYNLSDTSSADCALIGTGDQLSANPVLGPLQNNGGSTKTMALLGGSIAIQNGPPVATCQTDLGTTVDQRNYPRPGNSGKANCDIGAFETQ